MNDFTNIDQEVLEEVVKIRRLIFKLEEKYPIGEGFFDRDPVRNSLFIVRNELGKVEHQLLVKKGVRK